MKKVFVLFLIGIASNARALDLFNQSKPMYAVGTLSTDNQKIDTMMSGVCDDMMCRRFIAESKMSVAVIATVLLQCFTLPALLSTQQVPVKQSSCKSFAKTESYFPPKKDRAVVPYKKEEIFKKIKIRKYGRLQQPKK
ncbi:MAG TPA: hypothetical protein VLG50_02610 [Candidatus Saccharimonadales bacterium]|nr:hypothetical protein [Candidatus Saccharimonadales bacterium]